MNKWISYILFILFFGIGFLLPYIPQELFIEEGSIVAVVLLSLPSFYALIKEYNKGAYIIIALGLFALAIESIGIATGFPYSSFEYLLPFGYKLFGTTPWTVFLAWSPLVIGAYLLSERYAQGKMKYLSYLLLLIGLDLVLDPGAVARGLWSYTYGGAWFDVPLVNFLGWIFSGTLAYIIIKLLVTKKTPSLRWVQIGSLSLSLSLSLWTGVVLSYGYITPSIIGTVLLLLIVKQKSTR